MPVAYGSIKKNGNVVMDRVQVWVNCKDDQAGHKDCWGYMNPEWEDPIGVNDPEGGEDLRYELELDNGDTLPIRVWDHRDTYFVQSNQNGFRTIQFKTA
ncbi:hypothetical protein [Thiohalorhabdus sp.]|uniref:hypothetical protein n=1 Tax=Thiohalorhabdus sp. TaxID=3094134 RepID=UPI002FC31180